VGLRPLPDYGREYRALAEKYLGRRLRPGDRLPAAFLDRAERRLRLRLPRSLREYYLQAGRCQELNRIHHELYPTEDLRIDGNYLVFMDENQSVVSWGVRIDRLEEEDPIVWQRNNTPPITWYSERKRFTAFLRSVFNWYAKTGVFEDA
jgi:hypothetical protein